MTVWVADGTDTAFPTGSPTFSNDAAVTTTVQPVANALVTPSDSSSAQQGDVTVTTDMWYTVYDAPSETTPASSGDASSSSSSTGAAELTLASSSASSTPATTAAESSATASSTQSAIAMSSSAAAAPSDKPVSATNDKKVFAHFMVGVVSTYVQQDWVNDMQLAKSYGIDGFALNIGKDPYTNSQLSLAYAAAQTVGFLVFISFDFNWFSVSDTGPVIDIVNQFVTLGPQFRVLDPATNQQSAYVSSFAGDGFDWAGVKSSTGKALYVVPNWQPTAENANHGGVDGLYSWYAWPSQNNGPIDEVMTTEHDNVYLAVVQPANKLYMAPVSPWFSTHFGKEVSYSKNWLFKSEALWHTRWEQILAMQNQVQFLEIVTWNDYGESHYVGPVDTPHTDDGSSRWAKDMPHDALLEFAKPYINAFKTGSPTAVFDQDMLVYWYRPHLKSASCDSTDNCGSKPNGWEIVSDSVFVAAFSKAGSQVTVTSGSNTANTTTVPAGVTMLEFPMGVGSQQFSMSSADGESLSGTGNVSVSADCWNGIYNYNIYSGMLR